MPKHSCFDIYFTCFHNVFVCRSIKRFSLKLNAKQSHLTIFTNQTSIQIKMEIFYAYGAEPFYSLSSYCMDSSVDCPLKNNDRKAQITRFHICLIAKQFITKSNWNTQSNTIQFQTADSLGFQPQAANRITNYLLHAHRPLTIQTILIQILTEESGLFNY